MRFLVFIVSIISFLFLTTSVHFAHAQTVTPQFNGIYTCPGNPACPSGAPSVVISGTLVYPTANVALPTNPVPNPSTLTPEDPCAADASIADNQSKHWRHGGGLSSVIETLLKFFIELINTLLKLVIGGQTPVPNPNPTPTTTQSYPIPTISSQAPCDPSSTPSAGPTQGPNSQLAPPANPSQLPSNTAARFPGDPNPRLSGKAYWGSSIGGNGDPSRHEGPTGKSLSVRRTFWQWDQAGMYTTVQEDHAANRLPFISVKPPSWAEVAAGQHDMVIDNMLRKLDADGKPVWLTFHHEPEGGGGVNSPDDPGGAAAWRGMQTKVRERMNAIGTKNIAFMPILMAWTFDSRSGRNPNDWWVPGIWDAYIVDHYSDATAGDMTTNSMWTSFVSWIEPKGLPYGTGEWGNRGTDAATAQRMQDFWEWGFKNKKDVVVYSYFDSGLNSPSGSWELVGAPLTKFQEILKNDPRVKRIND